MGNANGGGGGGNVKSLEEYGRPCSDEELIVLYQLQKKLFTRLVASPNNVALLQRYWKCLDGDITQDGSESSSFERISNRWHQMLGFSTTNPADDLKTSGVLGLENIVLFVENFPAEAKMMMRTNTRNSSNILATYPFIKSAMAICRVLCETFYLIDEEGLKGKYPIQRTLYWQLIGCELDFFRLFAFCFIMYDQLFWETVAAKDKMQSKLDDSLLIEIIEAVKSKLLQALNLAPRHFEDLKGIVETHNTNILSTPLEARMLEASNVLLPLEKRDSVDLTYTLRRNQAAMLMKGNENENNSNSTIGCSVSHSLDSMITSTTLGSNGNGYPSPIQRLRQSVWGPTSASSESSLFQGFIVQNGASTVASFENSSKAFNMHEKKDDFSNESAPGIWSVDDDDDDDNYDDDNADNDNDNHTITSITP